MSAIVGSEMARAALTAASSRLSRGRLRKQDTGANGQVGAKNGAQPRRVLHCSMSLHPRCPKYDAKSLFGASEKALRAV